MYRIKDQTTQDKISTPPHFAGIPAELKTKRRWCLWRKEPRHAGAEPTKIPYGLGEKRSKSNDPTTWLTFDEAVTAYNLGGYEGVGFFLGEEVAESGEVTDCWTGIDLDDCLEYESGTITDRAALVLNEFQTYRDVSPSRTGVKAICRGNLECRGPEQTGVNQGWCEVYCHGRFFALTGHQWGDVNTVADCQDEINWLVLEELEATPSVGVKYEFDPAAIDDAEVRNRANYARTWLAQQAPTQKGQKADPKCTAIASSVLFGFALPPEIAVDLLTEWGSLPGHVNEHGQPYPWTHRDMVRKVQHVTKTGSKEPIGHKLDLFGNERVQEMFDAKVKAKYEPPVVRAADPEPAVTASSKQIWFSVDDIIRMPNPEWLIDKHFTSQANGCIFGPSGSYKSFVALDMALSVATGTPYLGRFKVQQGAVLYVYSEGGAGLKYRLPVWENARGVTLPRNISFALSRFNLTDEAEANRLLLGGCEALGCLPSLIVVDTLTRNFGGLDTDNNKDMSKYVACVDMLREKTGSAAVSVHHTGWGNESRERGAKSLRDSLDACFGVTREEGAETIEVKCVKQKDAEELDAYNLRGHKLPVLDRSSLYLSYIGTVNEIVSTEKDAKTGTKNRAEEVELLQHIPRLAPDQIEGQAPAADNICHHSGKKRWVVDDILRRLLDAGTVLRTRRPNSSANTPFVYYQPA